MASSASLVPVAHRVNIAVFVAHEIELAGRYGHRLGADAEEAADVDDDLAADAGAVDMGDGADLFVIGTVNGGAFERGRCEFGGTQADMMGVVHRRSPSGLVEWTKPLEGETVPFCDRFRRDPRPSERARVGVVYSAACGTALGTLKEQISVGNDDGHVAILGAGTATLEISDRKHAEFIDKIEVGRPVGGQFRVALRFDDVPAATDMLEAAEPRCWARPRRSGRRTRGSRHRMGCN